MKAVASALTRLERVKDACAVHVHAGDDGVVSRLSLEIEHCAAPPQVAPGYGIKSYRALSLMASAFFHHVSYSSSLFPT